MGTIGIVSRRWSTYGSLTTPDPVALHEALDRLAREGVTHAALEASSHGLDQRRLDGIRIAAAGFTNLGRDHMDYHPDVEHYLAAKLRLFTVILPEDGVAVVDMDGARCAKTSKRRRRQRGVAGDRASAGTAREIRIDGHRADRLRAAARGSRPSAGRATVVLPLAGAFQASNALVAAGLAIAAGVDADAAFAALARLEARPAGWNWSAGRRTARSIFVDYAHKPEAMASMLQALRPLTAGRLVVVFGAGGDRDPGKRPLMGKAAAENADVVIVTDDNPRSEDPAAIRARDPRRRTRAGSRSATGARRSPRHRHARAGRRAVHRRQGPRDRPDRRRQTCCRSPTTRRSQAALAAEEAA